MIYSSTYTTWSGCFTFHMTFICCVKWTPSSHRCPQALGHLTWQRCGRCNRISLSPNWLFEAFDHLILSLIIFNLGGIRWSRLCTKYITIFTSIRTRVLIRHSKHLLIYVTSIIISVALLLLLIFIILHFRINTIL